MKKLKRNEIKQQHANKSKLPLPKDKPVSYWWDEEETVSANKNPQRQREKKELNEDSLEVEPKLRKAIPHKTRKK